VRTSPGRQLIVAVVHRLLRPTDEFR
jgi:hypothetical protein